MNRQLGVGLELLPKSDNVRVNRSRVRYGLIAPDRVEQYVARQRTVFIMQKERQQVVLRGSELDFLARPSYYPAINVHLNVAERECPGRVRRRSPKDRLDASKQFAGAEWLDYVVVSAHFQQKNLIDLIADRAEHDNRKLHARVAQLAADFKPVHPGELEIDEHQRWLDTHRLLETSLPIGDQNGSETFALEQQPNGIPKGLVVLDHQDGVHNVKSIVSGLRLIRSAVYNVFTSI